MKRLLLPMSLLILVAALGCERPPTEPDPLYRNLQVGDQLRLNVRSDSSCTSPDYRTGRVAAITERAVVVHDVNNPPGGFDDAEYREIGATFDALVYPMAVQNFGEPVNLNGNGRILIFYTRAVNELTPREQQSYVGGFFFGRDLFPQTRTPRFQACPGSNYAEMVYMLAPDPQGVAGRPHTKNFVASTTVGVLAHELQHLINAARRLHVLRLGGTEWNEEVWLNEALSHIAEELVGHRAAGLAPRQNIDLTRLSSEPAQLAFGRYYSPNFTRLQTYLANPDTASAIGPDNLATRGATWQFLRYAADRRGGDESRTWRNLVNSEHTGLTNLRSVLGADPMEWMQDWVASIYTDDAVPGIASSYQQPSWNFRSIYPGLRTSQGQPLGRYPLRTVALENGRTTALSIRAGSGAFFRFGVAPGARGEIRTDAAASSCLGGGPALSLPVGQVHKVDGSAAGAICLEGGAEGAEFTYIPFHASEVQQAQLPVSVTASGIVPAVGPPSPAPQFTTAAATLSARAEAELWSAQAWERRLRERERVQLSPLVEGTGRTRLESPSFSVATSTTSSALQIAIVRTR